MRTKPRAQSRRAQRQRIKREIATLKNSGGGMPPPMPPPGGLSLPPPMI